MNERFNIPMIVSIRYASGEEEIINMDRVDRIQFRANGATVRMHNYIIAEITEFKGVEQNPYAWVNQFCEAMNRHIRSAMDTGKELK